MTVRKSSNPACMTMVILLALSRPVYAEGSTPSNLADDSTHGNGKTALMLAARDKDFRKVQDLLQQGADVNQANNNGGTPIMYAALGGDLKIVKLFLAEDAEVNAVAKNGWSALMIAAAKGYVDVTKELLDNAADPNLQDIYHWTPLMRAVYEDREEIVTSLLATAGINPNHRGENGVTALHIATVQGYAHLVELLLHGGADKTIKDHAGRTPYEIARQQNNGHKLLYLLNIN